MCNAYCTMRIACASLSARCASLNARCASLHARCASLNARCASLNARLVCVFQRLKAAIEQNAQQHNNAIQQLHNNMSVMSQAVDLVTTNGAQPASRIDPVSTNETPQQCLVLMKDRSSSLRPHTLSLLRTALLGVPGNGAGNGADNGVGNGAGGEGLVKLRVADTSTPSVQTLRLFF